jgi:hypothetical protein
VERLPVLLAADRRIFFLRIFDCFFRRAVSWQDSYPHPPLAIGCVSTVLWVPQHVSQLGRRAIQFSRAVCEGALAHLVKDKMEATSLRNGLRVKILPLRLNYGLGGTECYSGVSVEAAGVEPEKR